MPLFKYCSQHIVCWQLVMKSHLWLLYKILFSEPIDVLLCMTKLTTCVSSFSDKSWSLRLLNIWSISCIQVSAVWGPKSRGMVQTGCSTQSCISYSILQKLPNQAILPGVCTCTMCVYHYQFPNNLSQCCLRSNVAFIYRVWKRMVIRKTSYFHSFSSKHTGKIYLVKISDESKTFTGRLWNGWLWNGEEMCPYFTVGRQFADVQNTIDNAKP